MGKITDEQRDFLDSFTCERLTKNPANQDLIREFRNEKGKSLVQHLKKDAWNEDLKNRTAYYLVKSSKGEIAFYFSLRCGALFEPLELEEKKYLSESLKEYIDHPDPSFSTDYGQRVMNFLAMKKDGDVSFDDIAAVIAEASSSKSEIQSSIERAEEDMKLENNPYISRVSRSFGGIEIAHFCKNEGFSQTWNKYRERYHITHSLGSVLFWNKLVPILIQTRERIGFEYIFLFAADDTDEQTLINYYTYHLRFGRLNQLGTHKPIYDFLCLSMSQSMDDLRHHHDHFFETFNHDEDDEDFPDFMIDD